MNHQMGAIEMQKENEKRKYQVSQGKPIIQGEIKLDIPERLAVEREDNGIGLVPPAGMIAPSRPTLPEDVFIA